MKCRDLLASISPQIRVLNDNVAVSAHFAGRPTTSLLWYQEGSLQLNFAFPPILQDVWTYPKSVETNDRPRQFFSGCYGVDLLNTHHSVFQGTIEQLRTLQFEISTLGRQLVTQNKDVSQDHILGLKVLLLSNIEGVVDAHKPLYSNEQFVTIKENLLHLKSALHSKSITPIFSGIKESLAWTGNEQLNAVLGVDLLQAVELVTKPVTSVMEAVQNAGVAWIHYAQGCLKLYVPNCPLDPAMKSIVKRDRFLRRKSELKDKIEANREFELQFTGQDYNPIIEQLKQRLENLGEEPPNSLIARPAESQMDHLQGDFAILLRTITGKSQDRVLASILQHTGGYKEEEQLLQKNLEQMIERLQSNYPLYKDIIDPLIGFLYSLKLGFSMVAMDIGTRNAFFEPSNSLFTPTDILTWASRNTEINRSAPSDQLIHKLWSLAAQTQVEGPIQLEKIAITTINNILHTLYRNWKITSIKEQEEARANASAYRYRGAEGDDEGEIKEMFPDYSEEENSEEADGQEKSKNHSHSELAVELAKCHTAMLLPEEKFKLSLKQLVLRGVSLCVKLLKGGTLNIYLSPPELELLLPAQILTLKDSEQWLFGHRPAANKYNFYKDENLEQAQKLVTIMHKLHYRILQLIETWPENVTLQDALEACQQIMNLANTTPVAKFLIHIEKLHNVLHEWQGVTSKQYSLVEHFDSLTQLTISWRRLELQAWPSLFDTEDERCQFEADSWWFFLYESIIANPLQLIDSGEPLDAHINDLMTILHTFVQNSTVGQFKGRLRLLRVFQKHISQFLDGQHRLSGSIENLVCYYTEYTAIFTERILEARKKAEKEVKEVILLASWKDTNIIALRESARRSHYKLYKIVRRYRASLGEPVLPALQGSMPEKSLEGIEPTPSALVDIIIPPHFGSAQMICAAAVDTWNYRPLRLLDIPGTVKFIQRISALHPNLPDAADIIDSFTSNIASSIKVFQALTPSVLTDENKDEVKHLKSRKRVAYTDALKELRLMGLKSNLSSALLARQESLEKIFATTLALGTEKVVDTTAATKYFNRTLEGLPRVRRTAQDHSTDLSSTEILRSIGFIEHLAHLVIQQRDEISRSSLEFSGLKGMFETYNAIGSCFVEGKEAKLYGSDITNDARYQTVRRVFKWLPEIFDYVLEVLKAHVEFREVQMADEVRQFTEWRGVVWDVDRQFSANKPPYKGLWDNSTKQLMEIAVSNIEQLTQGLTEMEADHPDIKYLTTQVLPWLATVTSVANTSSATPDGTTTLKDLDKSLQELCDSIFVALQRLNTINATYPTAEDEQGWFLKYQTAAISSIRALHIGDITRRMQNSMSLLVSLQPYTEKTSQVARAMLAAYSPILEQYQATCHEVISRLASLHRGACKMAYVLGNAAATIGLKGFCTPQEKSEEKGDSGKVESGTGLGEGEGMEDISKDVGIDEDLSEVAQEKDKEEGDKEIEGEKDAVDIDEMDGQIGDMQEKDEDEDDEGDEKESEENEMDEETGEVDELDPTSVDEKLWDEKGGEDSREQEGDTMGNKPQDDMEAKKENEKEGKEQEERKEGNQREEGEEEEEAPADEHDEVKKDDIGVADQHIPEIDTLDLPEDMSLDQEEKEMGEDRDGMDMDDLSDIEDAGKNMEDEGGKKEVEEFPEVEVDGEEKGDENKPVDEMAIGEEEESEEESEEEESEKSNEGAQAGEPKSPEEAKSAEETAPSEVHGIEGSSEKQQDNEAAPTCQNTSEQREDQGSQDQGKSERQSDEQAAGQQGAQPDQSGQKNKEQQDQQQSVEKNLFRKVGDILEKWHRQQKEILDGEKKEREQADEMVRLNPRELP